MKKNLLYIVLFLMHISVFSQILYENNATTLGIDNSGAIDYEIGGVSFFDYNKDGWDDLTFGAKGDGISVQFFKNNNGSFEEEDFGLNITGHVKQILWVDIDNDGDYDLFVAKLDEINRLYQNDGSFNFTDITATSGLTTTEVLDTFGVTFGDFNNDGFLDFFLSNQDTANTTPNKLYKNNGDSTFTDISVSAGISTLGHQSFCAVFFDFNNDNLLDIYIANDRFPNNNILYKNNGDETFTDVSVSSNANVYGNAMSTTIGDYNNDGWFDIYVTNTDEGNFLLKNNGDETFEDVAVATNTILNSVSWGANFLDADNDTNLDLYVSNMVETGDLTSGFFHCQTDLTYNLINTSSGFENDSFISFSNAIGDVDNNGLVDFVVVNRLPDNNAIWQNKSTNTNNWLKIKLEGVESNKDGVGNKIEIFANGKSQFRYTACGEGFLGQNSSYEFFGLADATIIDYIKVTWTKTGTVEEISDVAINQAITIQEGFGLSVNDFATNSLSVYPNPSNNGVFKFNVEQDLRNYKIKVTDILGRVIDHKFLNNTIDISNAKQGIYLITISSETINQTIKVLKE